MQATNIYSFDHLMWNLGEKLVRQIFNIVHGTLTTYKHITIILYLLTALN